MNALEEIGRLIVRFQAVKAAGKPPINEPLLLNVGIAIEWDREAGQWEVAPWMQLPGESSVPGEYPQPMPMMALSTVGRGATLQEAVAETLVNLRAHLPTIGIAVD